MNETSYAGLLLFGAMMSKKVYTPIGEERVVVKTVRWFSDDPVQAQKEKDALMQQYGPTTQIDKHEYDEEKWSWRGDGYYTVHHTEYRVSCIKPIYSEADSKAMWEENRAAMFAEFNEKYGKLLTKR